MSYPYAAGRITTGQTTATGTAQALVTDGSRNTNRILVMASAAGAYVGGANVTTSTGAAIPTTNYLELWIIDPGEVFVVGDKTVYFILEESERPQAT